MKSITKITNNIFKIFIELFIFNKSSRSKIKADWAKLHLKKYAVESFDIPCKKDDDDDIIIWQYWHQGKQNAPILIQKCFESIEKHENDKKIVVLSYDTIKNYVELPQKYYDLVDSGKISIAHFSDILRLYLLEKYGGCWIDSTIYLTDKIPQDILNSDYFVFQKDEKKDDQKNNMSCFFIRAKKHSVNLKAIKNAIEKYWSDYNFAINYFMFEHLSTLLSFCPKINAEWTKMPYYSAVDTGEFQKIVNEKFVEDTFNKIKKLTFAHKLSYKIIPDCSSGDTYYDYLTDNFYKKTASVVIPTLQKNTVLLDKLIQTLSEDESVGEIILIDNSTKGYEQKTDKLKVIVPPQNLFVNPSWNLGVEEAKNDIVALLNDDIIIPKNFIKNIIHRLTPKMGIVGYNSGDYVKPIEDINAVVAEQNPVIEVTKFMDLYFGIAMFFYKSSYYKIPDEIKIVYGDVWLYHNNLRNNKKNYRVNNQLIYHFGSLSSGAKALNPICKNDSRIYKKKMIKLHQRLFSYDNIWNCYKIRLLGITLKIPKKGKK